MTHFPTPHVYAVSCVNDWGMYKFNPLRITTYLICYREWYNVGEMTTWFEKGVHYKGFVRGDGKLFHKDTMPFLNWESKEDTGDSSSGFLITKQAK